MKMAGTIDSIFSKKYKIHIINKKKYKDWVIKAHEGPTNGYWYAPEKRADLFNMEEIQSKPMQDFLKNQEYEIIKCN